MAFNVTYNGFTPEAQTAFQFAVDVWNKLIDTPIPVNIEANWTSLGGALGAANPTTVHLNFPNTPQANIVYPVALANQFAKSDINGTTAEIQANFDKNANWYLGTDGNPRSNQFDFVTIAIHEITHSLGFSDTLEYSQGKGKWLNFQPFVFDPFVINSSQQKLIDTNLFPNPSSQLGSQLVSDDVFFNGFYAVNNNNGLPVKLYAPTIWEEGSSIGHLDENTFPTGTPDALMTPFVAPGEVIHQPSPLTLAILKDLGWEINLPELTLGNVVFREGEDNTNFAEFTINLSQSSTEEVTVEYATVDNTAIAGTDYTTTSGTLVFQPGEISQKIAVEVDAEAFAANKSFSLNLSSPSNALIGKYQTQASISDRPTPNPDPDRVLISIADIIVTEGNNGVTSANFTVSLNIPSQETVTVAYTTVDNTATTQDNDYLPTRGNLTFNPGETSKIIAVEVTGDTVSESSETFQVNLNNPSNADLSKESAIATISDDDNTPRLAVSDATVTEGDNNSPAEFTLNLSLPSTQPVRVEYATADDTAIANNDYLPVRDTLIFAPGETSKTVAVEIVNDNQQETSETFNLNILSFTNSLLADRQGIATITDDDEGSLPRISINDLTVTEGNDGTNTASFTVNLDTASSEIITVEYETADETAIAPEDYTAIAATLTFNPGETSQTIDVETLADNIPEADETFSVNLSNATNATIGDRRGQATITNDDRLIPPSLSINEIRVIEGDDGTTLATFTVMLSEPTFDDVVVEYSTIDSTATRNENDYTPVLGSLRFKSGETTKTITVEVKGDTAVEDDETFFVNLNNPVNAFVAASQGKATIVNDDAPALSINNVTISEADNQVATATFTVNLNEISTEEVRVEYATADGTATTNNDYTPTVGTITFNPGETSKTIAVEVRGDNLVDAEETFFVNLRNSVNANIAASQGKATIINNEIDNVDNLAPATLNKTEDNIFLLEESSQPAQLLFTLQERNASLVSEIGFFAVDDDLGTIDNLQPEDSGYLAAALKRSQVIFSALPDTTLGELISARQIQFEPGEKLVFYLVQNSTTETVLADIEAGKNPPQVLFATPSANGENYNYLQATQTDSNTYNLAWEDLVGGGDEDYNDIIMSVEITNNNSLAPLGTELQGKRELVDLRNVGEISVGFTVNSEAGFDNYVGFYTIDDEDGSIGDLKPGDPGYAAAAIAERSVVNFDRNGTSELLLEGLLAPYLIADGSTAEFLAENPENQLGGVPMAYFAYLEANPQGIDRVRLLGDNTFSFEDLPGGGDRDYEDMVVQLEIG
ncbi:MAG: Calx-beta domain-containing protein [Oscillatoria sp. PMC 1051.18]|nr:Calx-beta domain-containing protein [Oscillatoria sp. PMC 1050.18]MEC5028330.1 Calx-beta domain-containing protein [Oscillatoria sp. PMC 1051.18]